MTPPRRKKPGRPKVASPARSFTVRLGPEDERKLREFMRAEGLATTTEGLRAAVRIAFDHRTTF